MQVLVHAHHARIDFGMSDVRSQKANKQVVHLGPTANLLAAYLKAMTKASLEPLCIILAMQMRPLSSWSATFRNLSRGLAILDLKLPSRSTVELALRRPWRGMRTSATQSGHMQILPHAVFAR